MPDERNEVAHRAGYVCEYCRTPEEFSVRPFDVDHVLPSSREGSDTLDNLALACQGCNSYKHARITGRDPISEAPAPLFNPRRDTWAAHFTWSSDFTEVVGLTPTGRATVIALRLNRIGLVNLRRLLFEAGKHPPLEIGKSPS